jgi:hypothetical protein
MFNFKNISIQAYIAGLSYFALVVFLSLKNTRKMFLPLVILFGMILSLLIGYDINCLTTGNCTTWSWIRAISVLIVTLIIMIFSA